MCQHIARNKLAHDALLGAGASGLAIAPLGAAGSASATVEHGV
jgi:hypothetical protein